MAGVVADTSGAVIPGVTVVLSNKSTGVKYTQTTDSKGSYRFANVPPNEGYTAVFSRDGFTSVKVDNVTLSVGITRTQDEKLSAGATQEVEVSAANQAVTLNTTDASIGNNFNVELLNELPVQSRSSPAALFSLQPGVTDSSVTGARTDQTSITLDGMDVNDIAAGSGLSGIVGNAPVDAIQEFRGTVAGLPSNVGTGSGGQFQLVTKNGTNHFHGDLNEYHRDTTTVANSWFNNNAGVPRTPLIRNQFGGAISGPIKKDKLFFFFDFNTSRIIQSSSGAVTVPLDSYRNGNVSYINNNEGCDDSSRQNTTPTCISSISTTQILALDPSAIGTNTDLLTFINSRYPHANDLTLGDGVNTGGFRFTSPTPDIAYNYVGRVDYNLTSKQRFFARIVVARENATQSLPLLPTDPATHPFNDQSYGYVASHIWEIGNNKVNQFYYGDNISVYNFATTYDPTGASVYGFSGLSGPYSSPSSQRRRVPIPEVRDDFDWRLGTHDLNFGGTFKFIKTNSSLVNDFVFISTGIGGGTPALDDSVRPADIEQGNNGLATYDSAYALNLGIIPSLGANYNYTADGAALPNGTGAIRRYRFFQTEMYAGDTWKITPQLTLSYGLRYQLYSVPYETKGLESVQNTKSFDSYFAARVQQNAAGISSDDSVPLISYNLGGKANNGPNLYAPSYKDLAPRVAFAYNPKSSPKTVINGSAGIVYDRTVINAVNFIQDQSSYLFQNTANQLFGDPSAQISLGPVAAGGDPRIGANLAYPDPPIAPAISKPYTPFVDSTGYAYGLADSEFNTIIDPTLKDPYSINYNFGIQQEMPGNFIFKLSYAGRLGRRLLAQADAAQVLDFIDNGSGQGLVEAFASVTQQLRSGVSPSNVTPQPWFEDQIAPGWTNILAGSSLNPEFKRGDIADFTEALSYFGLVGPNIGMSSQFSGNTYLTNKGFSSYNGLLMTLTKNLSHGVQFDFNYTFAHSIDNVSAPANFIAAGSGYGFVCDATRPRECRGNSDFDVTHTITSDFIVALPVGRGKEFATHSSRWLDEIIGGWKISGIPTWRSGYAFNATGYAFVAGYANNAPVILTGNKSDLRPKVHRDANGTVYLYSNPDKAINDFVGPIGLTIGSRNNLRGPSAFNMDMGLSKAFPIIEDKLTLKFRADFFNVLNHPTFGLPGTDITSGSSFGQITGTSNSARVGQFSLRLEF